MERILYTVREVAEMNHVPRQTIYEWAKQPDFPMIKRGRCSLIPLDLFRSWVEKQATCGKEQKSIV